MHLVSHLGWSLPAGQFPMAGLPGTLFNTCDFKVTLRANNKVTMVRGHSAHIYSDTKANKDYHVELHDIRAVRVGSNQWRRLKRQLENHAAVRAHPHLIDFIDVEYSRPYIAVKTEHAKQNLRDLVMRMGPLPEVVAQWLLLQLLHAVDYCHGTGICNCDIKPSNIYVTYSAAKKPILKLANFACSKQYEAGHSLELTAPAHHRNSLGEIAFMAPEILQQLLDGASKPDSSSAEAGQGGAEAGQQGAVGGSKGSSGVRYDGASVDVWCMGVVLYYMLFNKLPFTDPKSPRRSLIEQVKFVIARSNDGEWVIPDRPSVSPQCVAVLKRMLAPRQTRCTLQELWEDPWIVERMPPAARNFNQELRSQHLEMKLTSKLAGILAHCEAAALSQEASEADYMC